MKNARTRIAVMTVILVMIVVVILMRQRDHPEASGDPVGSSIGIVKRIELMFDAAQNGDVDAWRECFADPLRSKLDGVGDRLSPASLKRSEADLKSFSTDEPEVSDDVATIVVEKVYSDHNERYRIQLKRIGGDWKISGMTGLDKHAPKVKFGTPVVPGLEIK